MQVFDATNNKIRLYHVVNGTIGSVLAESGNYPIAASTDYTMYAGAENGTGANAMNLSHKSAPQRAL